MRLLLVFLILMNLLYAAWNVYSPNKMSAALPPLDSRLKKLELIEERGRESVGLDDVEGPGKLVQVESPNAEPLAGMDISSPEVFDCYTLGPFKDREIMQQVRDSLEEQVLEVDERKRVETALHRYWVYIPPSGGLPGAQKMAQQLRNKQVKEFYIVLNGEDRHSISLGHFREKTLANRRLKRLRELGFLADISIIYTEYEVFWLDYRVRRAESGMPFNVDGYSTEEVSQISRGCM